MIQPPNKRKCHSAFKSVCAVFMTDFAPHTPPYKYRYCDCDSYYYMILCRTHHTHIDIMRIFKHYTELCNSPYNICPHMDSIDGNAWSWIKFTKTYFPCAASRQSNQLSELSALSSFFCVAVQNIRSRSVYLAAVYIAACSSSFNKARFT